MKYKEIYDGYKISECGESLLGKRGNQMKMFDNGKGYLIAQLRYKGKYKVKAIHRLVAEAWIPNPEKLSDVDHINGDRACNHRNNLRWVTHGENIKHSYGLANRSAEGENNGRCRHREDSVVKICEYLDAGLAPKDIRNLGYDYSLVRAIKSGKNWRHISKNFCFSSTFND